MNRVLLILIAFIGFGISGLAQGGSTALWHIQSGIYKSKDGWILELQDVKYDRRIIAIRAANGSGTAGFCRFADGSRSHASIHIYDSSDEKLITNNVSFQKGVNGGHDYIYVNGRLFEFVRRL